jgi:hypothetical protein
MAKRPILVVYDYGQVECGPTSSRNPRIRFSESSPRLQVVAKEPEWMTPDLESRIREKLTIDIDERDRGVLA